MGPHSPDIRTAIDRNGWHPVGVLPNTPAGPTWAYTLGLHERGLPELIVFGHSPRDARDILAGARDQLLVAPDRARAGEELGAFDTWFGPCEMRLGEVAPRWRDEFALWAVELYGPDVDVLQVVWSDDLGHFPDDPDYLAACHHSQPDLSRSERPWLAPFWSMGWFDDEVEPDLWVLAPVELGGVPEHRDEALPAAWTGDGGARILQPAVLADHVTAGVEVEVDPEPDGILTVPYPGITAPTHRLGSVRDLGERLQLSYEIAPIDAGGAEALPKVTRIVERFDLRAALGPGSIHLAVRSRDAERVRIAFRRLERDGMVRALPAYHAPPAFTDHPDCPQCRRERGDG